MQILPEMNWSQVDQGARDRVAAQRRRRLLSIGIAMSELLRELPEIEAAHVPADQSGGLEATLRRLAELALAKAEEFVRLRAAVDEAWAKRLSNLFPEAPTSAVTRAESGQP